MASPNTLPGPLRALLQRLQPIEATDSDLLQRFVQGREEAAFTALVQRHGPMVLGVARRVAGDAKADDVFQATFLVLAQKAQSLRNGQSLSAWLHAIAYRLSLNCRRADTRRQKAEANVCPMRPATPLEEISAREFLAIVDEELHRLPEQERLPLLLCCLEGRSQDEAARLLGCSAGAVKGRLERGREKLRQRLARRGLTLPAVLGMALLLAPTAVAAPLLRATFHLALAKGPPAAAVAALVDVALKTVATAKVKAAACVLLSLGLLAVSIAATTPANPPAQAVPEASLPQVPPERKDFLGDPLPDHALLRIGTARLQHNGAIWEVAISPDGRWLASCGNDRVVNVWDAADGKRVWQFKLPHWGPWALAFAQDGKELAAVSRTFPNQPQPDFRRWDLTPGQPLQAAKDFQPQFDFQVVSVALASLPGGGYLIAETRGADISLSSPGGPRSAKTLKGHTGRVMSARFTNDGQTLVSLGDDGTIRHWNPADGKEIARLPAPAMKGVELRGNCACLAITNDKKSLAVSLPDGSTRLLDAAGHELRRLSCAEQKATLNFSADGNTLITGGTMVDLWKVPGGEPIPTLRQRLSPLQALALSPDGKIVAFAGGHDQLRLAELDTGKTCCQHQIGCRGGLAFAPDGKALATAAGDKTIALWEVAKLRHSRPPLLGPPAAVLHCQGKVKAFAFAPDGKRLATAEEGGTARIYEVTTKRLLCTLKVSGRAVYAVAFAPDGQTLATMSEHGVRLWDCATGKERAIGKELTLTGHTVAFHPRGKTLAALHLPEIAKNPHSDYKDFNQPMVPVEDRMETVRLWDLASARETQRFTDPVRRQAAEQATVWIIGRSSAEPAVFTPDGRVFAAPNGSSIVLFETASGRPRLRLTGHLRDVTGLAFTPDGQTLVSASSDATVLIWDVTELRTRGKLRGNAADPWDLLADANSEKAGRAIWSMVATPAVSVKLLRKHLHPVRVDQEVLQKLITDLDAPQFAVRANAMRALADLAPAADEALTKKLRAVSSLEAALRIEQLLALSKSRPPTPEQLRLIRAVEVLERIGTPEARQLLHELAQGTAAARLTGEAREARARLRSRTTEK